MVHTLQQALIGAQSSRPRLVGIRTSMTMTINKTDLIQRLADKHTLSKAEAGRVLETVLDIIVTAVKKGDAVTIPGFGSFKQHARAARSGVNPSTGEKIKIAAAKLPKFTPGATFKAAVDPKAAARKAAKAEAKAPAKKVAAKKAAPAKKAAAKKK
jgi:DNA-binding protein HU-beta